MIFFYCLFYLDLLDNEKMHGSASMVSKTNLALNELLKEKV